MIHRYRVQNFKSLIDVDVQLSPVTVLVGKSGTGKSNFVESLRFLRDLLSPLPRLHDRQQDWRQCRPAMQTDEPTRFEIEFSISGIDDSFTYELALNKEGPQYPPLDEQLRLGDDCFFHQSGADDKRTSRWIIDPNLVQVPQPGAIALGRIPSISEVVIAFTALTSGIGCYAFSDAVLIGANQSRTQSNDGLDDSATNYLHVLKDIASNLQDLSPRKSIISSLGRVNPTVSAVELDNIHNPTQVVVGHKLNGKTLSLSLAQESAGFRRFYAHLLALYQRPPKQTLTFEHPEDGIHPGALSLLADEFKAAPAQGRGQVILTTHSPDLLDHFEPEQIRVVELDDYQTRIGPVAKAQAEAIREKLLDAGELLTVTDAQIEAEASST